jgi:FAD/FMN-containing dehydrogenase
MVTSSPLIQPTGGRAVAKDLRALLGPKKVLDDAPTITAYAVDASLYRIPPQAVVLVESEDDIAATIHYAVSRNIPLTPRAAGTNLTGSAIGSGIILDVSRMNRVLEVNPEERWARVQPGIVLTELNKQLSTQGLLFGPDPSSGDMCKLGGMIANNSSGPHTLRYGSVKDTVRSLRLCLASSSWIEARAYTLDDPTLERLLTTVPALRDVLVLTQAHADLIAAKRPTVSKNSCGYNLFELADGLARGSFDLPKLFVGSEGTLGVMSEATLTLVDKPKATLTALIHFTRLEEVGDAVPRLLTLRPSALEVMDANTLNLIGRGKHGIPADAAATLLIELDADPLDTDLRERADAMAAVCRSYRLASELTLAFDAERREQLWKARKALYPTLYRFDPKKKPINFVDDVVVPAERISELIRYLENFFDGQRVPVAIFGHIGNGNAHIVPLLDVNDQGDFEKMVSAYQDIHTTVLDRFGGSICGEHGDGRVRAPFVKRMFGEELYKLFVQVKKSFDPENVLNPGIKLSEAPFTDHIDYTRLSKSCATCAKCNSVCPVYDVFQSEDMSARGWFEIVTAKDYSYLNSKRVVEACLNCKSCRTICPAGVDVSDLILQKRAQHPNRLAGWIFRRQAKGASFEAFLRVLARTQTIWDRPSIRRWLERITTPLMKALAPTARLPHDLVLPKLASRHLRERYAHLIPDGTDSSPSRPVAYFHGCAANYFDETWGRAGSAASTLLRDSDSNLRTCRTHTRGSAIQYEILRLLRNDRDRLCLLYADAERLSLTLSRRHRAAASRGPRRESRPYFGVRRACSAAPSYGQHRRDADTCDLSFLLPSAGGRGDERAATCAVVIARSHFRRDAGCRPLRRRRGHLSHKRLRDLAKDLRAESPRHHTNGSERGRDQLPGLHNPAQERGERVGTGQTYRSAATRFLSGG